MPEVILPHRWEPRDYQIPLWRYLEGGGKRAINIWHRRAGKDDVCLHWAAVSAFQRPATYWHMLPEYAQGRKAIWAAVNPHTGKRRIDEAFPKSLRQSTNETEMFIRFKNGATWQVVGSDRYDSTVGSPPAGVTFSEWALANPAAYAYLAPILAENDGWALFITTSRGRNHAKSMLDMARSRPGWFADVLTVDDTKAISLDLVEQQRIEYHGIYGVEAGDALIEQEYYCSFEAAILGAYYGKEIATAELTGRIRDHIEIEPDIPVRTAWDLGNSDHMAIWCFQVVGDEIRVIDFLQSHGYFMDKYCADLDSRGYHGTDHVPHDAKVPSIETGRTRIETLISFGRKPELVPDHYVQDGINAVRVSFPKIYIDRTRCKAGLEALRHYRTEYDEKLKAFKDTPKKDWASHPADAFRYMCMAWRAEAPAPAPKPKLVQPAFKPMNEMTMDEWMQADEPVAGRRETL